ncbi:MULTISPECIES: pirin [unclassified Streptomyces]|uniref:pirin n=1 Tax=unclassified Streptomyces TaxID=2593676 RepID=UPI002E11EA85|nr:pirin [Streptomyces sp. NBC_01207]WTA16841.1 pirin [Streptomyces sp. NBC_00853]
MADLSRIAMFWNWIGRSQADIEEFREAWTSGTRYGEVKGYDGAPIPAPELPPTRLKPWGRMR